MTTAGIGGYGFSPYIYNTNAISRHSMNKVAAISDDMSKSKVDYSNLVSDASEQNPLKRGESKNFVDIIASQMALGSFQKDRLAQSAVDVNKSTEVAQPELKVDNVEQAFKVEEADNASTSYNFSNLGNYQMNKAIDAYSNAMNLYA